MHDQTESALHPETAEGRHVFTQATGPLLIFH